MMRFSCPNWGYKKSWVVRRAKRVCARCRHEWNPHRKLPLRLTRKQWSELLGWFVLEQSSNRIAELTGLNRRRVLRALTYVRAALKTDVPKQLSGIVEVDETYPGGKWQNKKKHIRDKGTKRGRGTSKQPVFGIYARNGYVWAEVVDNVDASTLQPLIKRKVEQGSTICSDTWKAYTGIATQGYVHRIIEHKEEFSDCKGTHINGLEGFWGYLKRKPASKGGIRKDRIDL